jgi:pimeloyl-ACP methyl ester carboxylesterase
VPSLAGRHVIFVAGFMNEMIPGYFGDNVAATEALGATTSILEPSSEQVLEEDTRTIAHELKKHGERPVVLFGHSKGGAGVLLTVLRDPQLVLSGRVEAVIVLQGSIGGSPLADTLEPVTGPGMYALTQKTSDDSFSKVLTYLANTLTPAQWDQLFSRIFYVRSAHDKTTLAAELAVTELALKKKGPNDGLLTPDQMKLSYGVDLGVLDADHAALTVSSFLATSTPEERKQFTLALYREVGRRLSWPAR